MTEENKADIVDLASRFSSKGNGWFRITVDDIQFISPRSGTVVIVGTIARQGAQNNFSNISGITVGQDSLKEDSFVNLLKKGDVIEFQTSMEKVLGDIDLDGHSVAYWKSTNVRHIQEQSPNAQVTVVTLFPGNK